MTTGTVRATTDHTIDVAVNLLWLAPGRVGGSEEYLTRQLTGLADPAIRPVVYCQRRFPVAHPELSERLIVVTAPFRRDRRGSRVVAEHTWLAARTRRADVVHHGGGTVPASRGGPPVLLTVHDLQYRALPHYFSAGRRSYLAQMMPRSVARATLVATPSQFVRSTVIDAFGADPDRVVVVPHGVPEIAIPTPEALSLVRERYGLGDRPYLVYPAITHPHKGHGLAVELLRYAPDDVRLVLIGGEGAAEPDLRRAIERSGSGERVIRTGRVGAADRDALLAGAEAMVFPSEYEGFGAPLVEAMALDVPVVAGDQPAVREIAEGAAMVVAGRDPQVWAAAIAEAREHRDELVAAGRLRRAEFTPAVSGGALAAAYRRIVEEPAR